MGSNRQLGTCEPGIQPSCGGSRVGSTKSMPTSTRHACHRHRAEPRPATAATTPHFSLLAFQYFSFSTEPVFRPGIGGIAVATDLPETGLVFGHEINRANKLGPLPCIKLRDNHARGAAVVARNRFAVELRSHERASSSASSIRTLVV